MELETTQHIKQSISVALVPTPGMGHFIPLVELAKRLVLQHNFHVTFIIPHDGSPMQPRKQVLESLPPTSISTILLPPVSFDDLPDHEDVSIEVRITLTLTRSLSALRETLNNLTTDQSTRLVALVVDLFGLEAFTVTREFGVPIYVFFSTTAMDLSLVFYLPELDHKFTCDFKDLPEPVQLPGCVPICGPDLEDCLQERNSETYQSIIHLAKQYPLAAGILVNSFMDLEPGAFKALMESRESSFRLPPVYPVGPLILTGSINESDKTDCLKWLDDQPNGSVLFVCFGSGGTLSQKQLNELALGLEMSGQRFLWVVKCPDEKATNATYFGVHGMKEENPFDYLPKGFLDRTKGVGLVVPSWAPQIQVLSHGSTGGFLSHCGWNSVLESIVHGVPIIAWPLYAEQKMNAVLLTDDLKVAWRVKVNEDGLVGREEVATYARGLIQGEDGKLLRDKMRVLKDAAANALSPDGFSTKSLANVAQKWKNLENDTN
ncbi:hypothetical protein CICLE_v10015042mg [Citrus x clementina]|uniref:Glycosyltransferase n=2 Tax=Citrus clementina TaxID=85681 RepID=V4U7Z0_CITCL|nr:hypothetical protein CICLE_v10015042mg [Citrus x clementina]